MSTGGSGGSSNNKTTTTSEPPEFQKPYLAGQNVTAAASTGGHWDPEQSMFMPFTKNYNPDTGTYDLNFDNTIFAPNYYPDSTIAGQDPYTVDAINRQASRAYNGNYGNAQSSNQMNATLAGNYLGNSPAQQYATAAAQGSGQVPGFIQAYGGNGMGEWQDPGTGAAAQASISQWDGGQGNPYLDDMVKRAQGQSLASVSGSFSKSGRYGSGAHEAAANDAAGNIATQMYGQAYDQDQNRSLSAWNLYNQANLQNAQMATQANMQTANRSLDAYNAAANRDLTAWSQNQNNMLQGWSQSQKQAMDGMNLLQNGYDRERDNMMNAMQFAPTMAQQDYQDIASLSEAGAAREAYQQSLINANIDRWNYDQSKGLAAMQNYGAIISGNHGMNTTVTGHGAQGASNALGNVFSGAMAGGALGSKDMMDFGPGYGAAAGGLLGALSSYMK